MVCESGQKRVRSESKRQAEVVDISAAGGDVATALDGEDVTDESLLKVKKDVAELAEKVMRFRETGPTAFASLVEKSLAQIRPSLPMSTAADYTSDDLPEAKGEADRIPGADDIYSQLADLRKRLAASRASLPNILRDMKACKERLDGAIKVKLSFQREAEVQDLT